MTLRIPSRPLPPPHTHMQAHAPYLSACSFLTLSPSLPPHPPLPPSLHKHAVLRLQDPRASAARGADRDASEHDDQLLHDGAQEPDHAAAPLHTGREGGEGGGGGGGGYKGTRIKNPTMLQRLFTQVGKGKGGGGEGLKGAGW